MIRAVPMRYFNGEKSLKNDIIKLSVEELLQKYTSEKEKGLYFLHEFGNLFIRIMFEFSLLFLMMFNQVKEINDKMKK